jgi:hypothetical protein
VSAAPRRSLVIRVIRKALSNPIRKRKPRPHPNFHERLDRKPKTSFVIASTQFFLMDDEVEFVATGICTNLAIGSNQLRLIIGANITGR